MKKFIIASIVGLALMFGTTPRANAGPLLGSLWHDQCDNGWQAWGDWELVYGPIGVTLMPIELGVVPCGYFNYPPNTN